MKRISINAGLFTLIDDEDYERVSAKRWTSSIVGRNRYVSRKEQRNRFTTHIYIHRFIMGANPGEYVDHINGDTLDNRRSNLRICTPTQNGWNKGIRSHCKTGYKGINLHRKSGLWGARIGVNGKEIWLGYSKTPQEAARRYDRAALKYHGMFARTNAMLGLLGRP